MKTVLCYGDSNTWGAVPLVSLDDVRRFDIAVRWPGALRERLGAGYWVVEEGLNGRTTVHDDPVEGEHRNGRTYLRPCLETHAPIDLVILMLGTNDLKHRFAVTPWDIAASAGLLIDIIRASTAGVAGNAPRVLLMCPPPLLAGMFTDGREKSRALAPHYAAVAEARGCAFVNAGEVIECSEVDGIHFDAEDHVALGTHLAGRVPGLLA
ncbi:MAG: SGNH/GDSL hydrolase family protein [Alphaproteobacteria bacterium]|nr:SGNH/GDSL hydrolase family protein [Alphaproteobacteria bacterium]